MTPSSCHPTRLVETRFLVLVMDPKMEDVLAFESTSHVLHRGLLWDEWHLALGTWHFWSTSF
jgi:hypothetical protein